MRKKLVRSLLVLVISATTISAYAQPAIPKKYVEHPGFFCWSKLWSIRPLG